MPTLAHVDLVASSNALRLFRRLAPDKLLELVREDENVIEYESGEFNPSCSSGLNWMSPLYGSTSKFGALAALGDFANSGPDHILYLHRLIAREALLAEYTIAWVSMHAEELQNGSSGIRKSLPRLASASSAKLGLLLPLAHHQCHVKKNA